MRTRKLIAAMAVITSAFTLPSALAAQEQDPPPPAGLMCNGVTCEGWIVTGYDPIDGSPILSYVVFPDPGGEAPYPP